MPVPAISGSLGNRARDPACAAAHQLAGSPSTAVGALQRVQEVLQVVAAVAIAVAGLHWRSQGLNSIARIALCLVVNLHLKIAAHFVI